MAEQQLIDYIKKAREAKQSDEQSRALLYKNGWTEAEVSGAFSVLNQQPSVQPKTAPIVQEQKQTKPQQQPQPQAQTYNQPKTQPQPQTKSPAQPAQPIQQPAQQPSQYKAQRMQSQPARKTILKVLIALIIVVVVAGAAYFVVAQYANLPWKISWNFLSMFGKSNPEKIIASMASNMKEVLSSRAITEGTISLLDGNGVSQVDLLLNADSKIDIKDAGNAMSEFSFSIGMASKNSAFPSLSMDVNMISVGAELYFKLNDFSLPPGYSYPKTEISQAQGKWFIFDQNSVNTLLQAGANQTGVVDLAQALDSRVSNQDIQNWILNQDILLFDKQLDSEEISGQDTYHYLTVVKKDKIKEIMHNAITQMQQAGNNNVAPASLIIDGLVNTIGDINIEMWIGKKDNLLYKIKFDKTIDLSKIGIVGVAPNLRITSQTIYSDFNKALAITAPEGAQKIETILLPMLKIQNIQSYMKGVGSVAQMIFIRNQSYASLCARGLLNGYQQDFGDDLISANNKIVAQGAEKPACFSGSNSFCLSTQMADGNYMCIDETSSIGSARCLSSATVCE